MNDREARVLILGIGNLLRADDGFGVRTVERLRRHYRFPERVKLLDGGTGGISLLPYVREADILVVFDAVDFGLPPATFGCIEDDEVPRFLGAKRTSLHQAGFQEVLSLARMLGDSPRHLLLVGVQPEEVEKYGSDLRDAVRGLIDPAIQSALAWLAARGVPFERVDGASAGERVEGGVTAPGS